MRSWVASGLLILVAAAVARADETGAEPVLLSKVTAYDRYAGADRRLREQCGFETLLPQKVAEHNASVSLAVRPQRQDGRVLELEILSLTRSGRVVVRGRLFDRARLVGSFRAEQRTPFKRLIGGACGIPAALADRVGRDIAWFLQGPRLNAVLGLTR